MGIRIKLSRSDRIYYLAAYTLVTLLALVVLYPLVYIVSASFSTAAAVNAGRVTLLPVDPTLYNYGAVLRYPSVYLGYRNTLFYTAAGTLINVVVTMMCAYPLARRGFSGRKPLTFLFTFTMIFSGGMIPNYILMRNLRILNTVWVMLLPGAVSVHNMIVTRSFLQNTTPEELLEASKLDGCSDAQYFFRVILPLSKAILAVITLYYAVGHWNAYFSAFLYLSDRNLYPLQIFLRQILVQNQFDAEIITDPEMALQLQGLQNVLKYAIIVVATAPLMCFYPFVQKHFVKGVMIGSLKG
jgi:putative aldouronate transport system permease protein